MTKHLFSSSPCSARCSYMLVYNPYRKILYNTLSGTNPWNCFNRFVRPILTELCFRCRGAATGLSASQVEQPLFSVHHLVAKTFFGRLKPSYSFAFGKWFTPSVGARINYSGLQFKDGALSTQSIITSMQTCCGMSLVADMPGRNRYVGGLRLLLVPACCIMLPTDIIRLLYLMVCRGNTAFQKE